MMNTYGESSSVHHLSFIYIATTIPALFINIPCGIVIDKFSKKINLFLSDMIIALAMGILFLCAEQKIYELIFIVVILMQIGISYQGLTNQTLIAHYFSKDELNFINSIMQLKKGLQKLIAPALGGYLYSIMPIKNILLLHGITMLLALLCLALIKIPLKNITHKSKKYFKFSDGFICIIKEKHLIYLAIFFAQINFLAGIYSVVYTPVLLEFADEKALGLALSLGSLGMIIGSFISMKWRLECTANILFWLIILNGLSEIMTSYPSFYAFSLGLFLSSICSSLIAVTNQVLWQSAVPASIQGRVFATRDVIAMSSLPLGMFLGGFLGDWAKINLNISSVLLLTGFAQIAMGLYLIPKRLLTKRL